MAYELLFDGDPNEDTRYLAGLVDIEALLEKQQKMANEKPRTSKRLLDLVGETATL